MSGRNGAILIAGPTASGKSALALALARHLSGEVINADSMQVYADLAVLTARPTPQDEAAAPHRLYGHVDGGENFSVGRYVEAAARALGETWSARRIPIVVGGTGLYFKALIDGLSEIPPVPPDVRERLRRDGESRPTSELHAMLAERDPDAAGRLRPSDRMRIQRALEVFEATGRPLASFHGQRQPGPLAAASLVTLFVAPEREALRRHIDARFTAMMAHGALDEVAALARRGLDPMLPVMRAHGVPGLISHLRGEASLADAVARGQADTRRYAKRQFTWFRHQMPGWTWVAPKQAFEAAKAASSAVAG